MAPKKDKEKEKELKNRQSQNAADAEKRMKDLIDGYDKLCREYDMGSYPVLRKLMKTNMEESKVQSQFIFDPNDRQTTEYWEDEMLPDIFNLEYEPKKMIKEKFHTPLVKIRPFLEAIRNCRYLFIKELLVWRVKVDFEEITCLAYLLNKRTYMLARLELIDCLLDEAAILKLMPTINKCSTLRELVLDCNDFGDVGCHIICNELKGCSWLYQLSLNHCGITQDSGLLLGQMVSTSTIRELFLEGNCLENEGLIIMVGVINAGIMKQESAIHDQNIELKAKFTEDLNEEETENKRAKSNQKKKKDKKSNQNKQVMLPKGPEISKLNLANNGIGRFGIGDNFAPIFSMQVIKNLIFTCKDLEEIDLFANDIGDVAARLILDALTMRKIQKYPQIGIRMCHLINQDIHESILKLAPGSKKKKRSARER